ncbi:MAG: T9SS type A sorting domain-containing protein [Bacteroidetes bacterium]|nr:T9SS type A sorting domain-containing protein [Bacteroidota bacterium]
MKSKLFYHSTLLIVLMSCNSVLYSQDCLCGDPENISVIWSKTFDIEIDDAAWDFVEIDDGDTDAIHNNGYIFVGSVNDDENGLNNGMDIYIARLSADGNTIVWDETWDGGMSPAKQDVAYSVIQTSTGAIVISGSTATNYFGPGINRNAWVGKMNVDGEWISGWPKQYGSTGDDIAYDVAEDQSGNYVLAGTASASGNDLGTQTVHSDGDYWVFKIGATGYLNTAYSKVYYGSNTSGGNDYAQSVAVDCNSGDYVVSGFCKSCAPATDDHSQLYLLKIPSNFATPDDIVYGYDGDFIDFGSFDVIQAQATFGSCSVGDGFLSLGVQHPSDGCFLNFHDFWVVITDDELVDLPFTEACVDADAGGAYGGKKNDNGFSSVQACSGFLLTGNTSSNNLKSSCELCQVECNHYDCNETLTEDIWLAKINPENGDLDWEESLGEAGNQGAYSIKRLHDGAYMVVGYTSVDEESEIDFYIVKFELTATCLPPEELDVDLTTYCATLSWTMDPCVPQYDLKYKEGNGAFQLITDVTSPYIFTNTSNNAIDDFSWGVRARCSPGELSSYTLGDNFSISYCGSNPVNCTTCTGKFTNVQLQQAHSLISYPNPSDGAFRFSLHLSSSFDEFATIEVLDPAEKVLFSSITPITNGLIEQRISVQELPSGFYLLRVTIDGMTYKNKLVFNKH